MYVYCTSGFNQKAERYGIHDRINDLCAELQTQRIDEVQAHFERVYPYLKRRILNRRLIARILKVDNEQLLCLLDIFKRGDSDYERFLEAPRDYGRTYLEPQIDLAHIRNWLTQTKLQQHPTQPLPPLPTTLRPWLEPPSWEMETAQEDWVIYESAEWVRQFAKAEIQDAWETYYQIISKINSVTLERSQSAGNGNLHSSEAETVVLSADTDETQSPDSPQIPDNVQLYGEDDRYILYSQLETTDGTVRGVLFLLAPFDHQPSQDEIAEVGKRTALFNGTDTTNILSRQLNLYELTPFAHRSYPAYLLADEESWLAIERGKEANLALSAEEEQILQSVSTSTSASSSLPLFINGRAGSGKSTMLIYLFADYCYRKYYTKQGRRRPQPLPGEPLFLTYNERLLEVARDGVKRLLSSHHRFVAERSQTDELPNIDHYFQPFGEFLLNLLPPQERDRFNPEHYISFHRFKQLYRGQSPCESFAKAILHLPQARRYSPETCWHVIRSFIKGYRQQEYMTPEDYQEDVPRKERTIDLEKFQGIYDTIWERWYKHLTTEQGYWDDQDLIAKVLELQCYHPDHTAIFCDEAQDFTRLELQLIMRLSIFSQYHLGYQPLQSLPFAFAGDPFQTLNPTGFHWSSTQAAFDAEVITALDPAEQLRLAINFQELAFNYRSSPPIVQSTNLIQLWRHVLFDIPELNPQTAWHPGNFLEPQKFILNQNITTEELATYIQNTIIIVPCEEGEEAAYAQADEVLSKICRGVGELGSGGAGEQRSRGAGEQRSGGAEELESRGAGERGSRGAGEIRENLPNSQASEPLKNVLSAISAKGLEFKRVILYKFGEDCNRSVWNLKGIDQKVKVEYFFNKLYVAASRATEYLFIVDSEKGDRQLWQYASDEALLQAMLGHARSKTRWEENVRTISPGTPATARQMREDDPGAIALEFETKGLNAENPGLLRRAKQFYNDMGDQAKADFCEAWALKFEGHFCEAGSYFLGFGDSDEAWDCFWQGMCWLELVNWYNLHPEQQTAERFLTLFMAAPPQDLDALHQFASVVLNREQTIDTNEQWTQAIQEYANRIEAFLNNPDLKPEQWQQFGEVLAALECAEPNRFYKLAGDCFFRAQNYELAIQYWEAGGAMQTPEYFRAKALRVGMPEGLRYLAQAGECDRIIAEWQQAGKPRDRQWLTSVAFALESKQHYQQAFVIYVWLDELVKVKACFEAASFNRPPIKLLTVLFQYLFRRKYCREAIDAIETYLPIVTGSQSRKLDLKFDIIYEISSSELSPHDLNHQQRQYCVEFIKTQILSTPDWYQYLLIPQVGIALEKVGSLTETLSFYEQFVNCIDPELRQFARERWIATKKKQEEYVRNQNNLDKARQIYSELLRESASWAIAPDSVSVAPPLASRERPRLSLPKSTAPPTFKSQPPTVQEPMIQGLPSGTKVEHLEDGIIGFEVRHLGIKVMSSSQQVLITDILNSREVRVDWEQCQVNIGEATIEAMGSHQLSFALFTSGYRGVLICEKIPRLELEIQGCRSKIVIELR